MRVLGVPSDVDGSGNYRFFSVCRALGEAGSGHECGSPRPRWVGGDADGTGRRRKPVFDLFVDPPAPPADVYVFTNPVQGSAVEFSLQLPAYGRGLVVDLDDDLLDPPLGSPFREGTARHNGAARELGFDRRVVTEMLGLADVVTVSTPALAGKYSEWASDIRVLRNVLDARMLDGWAPAFDRVRGGGRVRVGWYGSLGWRRRDLRVLQGVLGPWLESRPNVEMVLIGPDAAETADFLGVPAGQRLLYQGWFDLTDLLPLLAEIDVGVVPLERCFFNDCKSYLKAMEFNAAGVPVLASPSAENEVWLEDGVGGWVVDSPAAWRESLDFLVSDGDARRSIAQRARSRALQHTVQESYPGWLGAWSDAFCGACSTMAMGFGALQQPLELDAFLRFVWQLEPKVIVEIGCGAGGTLMAWRRLFPRARIVAIDLPGGRFGGHLDLQLPPGVTLIRGDSHAAQTKLDLLAALAGERIDLLFVDGDHTLEGVRQDWEMYGPLADVVAFHDIVFHDSRVLGHPEVYDDVNVHDFWEGLDHPGKTEIVASGDWGGIGIVVKERERVAG